jgi:hypothetical protein
MESKNPNKTEEAKMGANNLDAVMNLEFSMCENCTIDEKVKNCDKCMRGDN